MFVLTASVNIICPCLMCITLLHGLLRKMKENNSFQLSGAISSS